MRFVRNIRRGRARDRSDWKVMLEINIREIASLDIPVPSDIIEHWKADKSRLGYARVRSLSEDQLRLLAGLAKAGKVRLGVTRWGDVNAYKVVQSDTEGP